MNLDAEDIINRYASEVARLTQRALIAESRADAAEAKQGGTSEGGS